MKLIDAKAIAETLNEMMTADPLATHALIINRVPCNKAMADHPHVIVDQLGKGDRTVVGLLGVLNGLLASAGSDSVVGSSFSDDADSGTGHKPLLGFAVVSVADLKGD